MRFTQLFGTTLRETPSNADVESYQLLLRAGYIRQLSQGIFSFLPLGWRVHRKLEEIMRREMDVVGGQELQMPVVHPAEMWQKSGRYHAIGPELVRFADRRSRPMVLAMTHEEIVAHLSASEITSYHQLPRLVYQIQTKFRDDPRPRAGLIRVREFMMKDAYSLDADGAGMDRQYRALFSAYFRIFGRAGLPVLAVGADTGIMGGNVAHEYMYLTPLGEDTLVLCDNCGYSENRQVAEFQKPAADSEPPREHETVETPGASSIEDLAKFLGVPKARIAKLVFMLAEQEDDEGNPINRPVVAVIRGDMDVNETKLASVVGKAGELRPMNDAEVRDLGAVPGYASPMGLRTATVVVDDAVTNSPNLITGANREGYHVKNLNLQRDLGSAIVMDIAAAQEGDACIRCGSPLRTTRGVEVGNIFAMGDRYANLGATFLDSKDERQPIMLGSYGIGVGRMLACIAEEWHDDRGLCWPITVAPYQAYLTAQPGSQAVREAADRIFAALRTAGLEIMYDDREARLGVKFADCDLIGVPIRLTVSEKSLAAGGVEVKLRREREVESITSENELPDHLWGLIRKLTSEVEAGITARELGDGRK